MLNTDTPALPPQVPPEKCRCAVGSILSEGEESPSSELIQLYQKFGFKVFSFPAPSHVVTATFPYTTALSIWLAARRVHPALDAYIKVRQAWNVCAGGGGCSQYSGWKPGRTWQLEEKGALGGQHPGVLWGRCLWGGKMGRGCWHLFSMPKTLGTDLSLSGERAPECLLGA